jgi:hypothetical protein
MTSNIEENENSEEKNESNDIEFEDEFEDKFEDEFEDKFEDELDCNQMDISINCLPYVVFEYILSHLSPYRELSDCKLVSKSWRMSVKCKFFSFIYHLINH